MFPVQTVMFYLLLVANKVALLIGNEHYHDLQLGKLFHPINDVCDLTGRLVSMGFKVSCGSDVRGVPPHDSPLKISMFNDQ